MLRCVVCVLQRADGDLASSYVIFIPFEMGSKLVIRRNFLIDTQLVQR